MNEHRVTVTAKANASSSTAHSIAVYLPTAFRREAGLIPGDTFDLTVKDNKCALRYSEEGILTMNANGCISINANHFEPPLKGTTAMPVNYRIKDDWLVFQIPYEMEYVPKGFGLVQVESKKGFGNV